LRDLTIEDNVRKRPIYHESSTRQPLQAIRVCCKDMDYFRKKQEKGGNISS